MTQTEALKLARGKIEAAQMCHPSAVQHLLGEACDLLNKALARPEPEPVAWLSKGGKGIWFHEPHPFLEAVPLYTTPPPVAEPHKQEQGDGFGYNIVKPYTHAVQPKEPEQEPVAWMDANDPNRGTAFKWKNIGYHNTPLYTTPPQQKPLTDEQRKGITAMWSRGHRNYTVADIIDAVEASHGIKGDT